jgi:baculoviral IAP repeat-containing protein 6
MLNTLVYKKDINMFNTNPIDYLLVNWNIINPDVYINNIKYNNIKNHITFDVYIGRDVLCFKLLLLSPENKQTYFELSCLNQEINDDIANLIIKYNAEFISADYSEINDFIKLKNIFNYNSSSNLLIQFLNKFNDEFETFDYSDTDSDSNSYVMHDINETTININMNNIPMSTLTSVEQDNTINDKKDMFSEYIKPIEIMTDIEDIWDNDDDFKNKTNTNDNFFLDQTKIITVSMEYLEKNKNAKINLKDKINHFSDFNRIQMLINEINSINAKYNIIKVMPVDNNVFVLSVKFSRFNSLKDIEMNINLDSNLYPYYPPTINFNVKFNDNLEYMITDLDYFKVCNWNPTNSLDYTLSSVWDILNTNGSLKLSDDCIDSCHQLFNELSIHSIIKPLNITNKNIKIAFNKLTNTNNVSARESIGYGTDRRSKFDINSHINSVIVKNNMITECLKKINKIKFSDDQLINSCVLPFVQYYIKDIQLLDVNNNCDLYNEIFNLVNNIIDNNLDVIYYQFNTTCIYDIIYSSKEIMDTYVLVNDQLSDVENKFMNIINKILIFENKKNVKTENTDCNLEMQYINFVNKHKVEFVDKFIKKLYTPLNPNSKYCNDIKRIAKEITTLKSGIISSWGSSIFVKIDQENMALMKIVITGPNNTPYENGFFEFHIKLNDTFPKENPSCHFQTTGGGKVRFNPNLYDSGKVCLSLLGTWRGHESESWNEKTSSLLQLILSIQSLILCEQPYFNEPGYESSYGTASGNISSNDYNRKIQEYTIQYAIIEQINNPPENFDKDIYGHFHYKKQEILKTFEKWSTLNTGMEKHRNNLINALEKASEKFLKNI